MRRTGDGAEEHLDPAEAQLARAADRLLAANASAVDVGPIGGVEVDDDPPGSSTDDRRMRARYAVILESNVALPAAADLNHRSLDPEARTLVHALVQYLQRCEEGRHSGTRLLQGGGLRRHRHRPPWS